MFNPATIPSAVNALVAASPPAPACAHSFDPRRWLYVLRDIVHDWTDEDVVRILSSLRVVLRDAATLQCTATEGAGGSAAGLKRSPAGEGGPTLPVDRIALVARVIKPGAGFIESQGTNDADIVMVRARVCVCVWGVGGGASVVCLPWSESPPPYMQLSGFGTTAGERTIQHFDALFARSGLRRVSVTPVRGYYSVIVAESVPSAPTS
jgi:hypothetical protein